MIKSTDKIRDKKGRFKKGRPKGGGRKPGTKDKKTIDREEALKEYHQAMLRKMKPLILAQQSLAEGLTVVLRPSWVKNPKTKKLERQGELRQVTDPDEIEELLNSDGTEEDYHIISAKDPNVKALQDIFDRTFGKAKEQVELNVNTKELLGIQNAVEALIEGYKKDKKNGTR